GVGRRDDREALALQDEGAQGRFVIGQDEDAHAPPPSFRGKVQSFRVRVPRFLPRPDSTSTSPTSESRRWEPRTTGQYFSPGRRAARKCPRGSVSVRNRELEPTREKKPKVAPAADLPPRVTARPVTQPQGASAIVNGSVWSPQTVRTRPRD